eukprot:GHRQ01022624.1.p2 GENE.GHRQ01022624.1~~GHRQ01022624.1.p2  ORF type:complete len:133 (-),score=8.43 GHRQ01022624.1:244-642(-)
MGRCTRAVALGMRQNRQPVQRHLHPLPAKQSLRKNLYQPIHTHAQLAAHRFSPQLRCLLLCQPLCQAAASVGEASQPASRLVLVALRLTLPEVALHDELVLLRVAPADDQVVLTADEPVEALKPGRLAHHLR